MRGKKKTVFFLINLLQDVNVVRGLVYLAARETDAEIGFLISEGFMKRDNQGIWQRELTQMAADVGAQLHLYGTPFDAYAVLQRGAGMIFAASESNLSAHRETHEVLRIAPPSYLTVTLQHGLECVGFLQSREHVMGHGRNIGFGADVVCGWFEAPALTSMIASERAKLYVSGPPTLLSGPVRRPEHPPQNGGGIVCENMHSVRLRASGDHKASFMDIFFEFCGNMSEAGRQVTLRPHPGGQYVIKNNVTLPENVQLNNLPIYHVDMPGYAYGISAPSTIVFDMVLAGIPVGVWRDAGGVMDAGNYTGLTEISTLEDWLAFERDARLRPDMLLQRQRQFLDRLQMPTDPAEVNRRFARLLTAGLADRQAPQEVRPATGTATSPAAAEKAARQLPRRVLFIANGVIPTLQLSFLKPLAPLFASGEITHRLLTEQDILERFGSERRSPEARSWTMQEVADFAPDLIVCCRYSGPHPDAVLDYGRHKGVPVIYHVDDDLLNIPPEIGEKKHRVHNDPKRIRSVRQMLEGADLRYFSTPALKRQFRQQDFYGPAFVGQVYCTSRLHRVAEAGPVRRIGYMGFDHAHDFEIVLPALERYLERYEDVEFELFGSIPMPDSLARFGARVREVAPERDYQAFLKKLAARKWDIGICPLAQTPFNAVKANTKWVEYTACGMASIASRGSVYHACVGEDRGLLVADDGWFDALEHLTEHPQERLRMAQRAQVHLLLQYSEDHLRNQVLDAFDMARELAAQPQDMEPEAAPLAGVRRLLTATADRRLKELTHEQ